MCQSLSKVTVTSCSFTSNVSSLLLDDVLLKCVVSEVALFSVVALITLIYH